MIVEAYNSRCIMVLTVPMRNGNPQSNISILTPFIRSYRTYEEWKPPVSSHFDNIELVLTVPMRNGNITMNQVKYTINKFLPYL